MIDSIAPKLLDVAEGLNYLHANYTIHGDLKGVGTFPLSFLSLLTILDQPNILVDRGGRALLADFGLASIVYGMNSVHATKSQGYTVRWAAPEILKRADKITREADIFAFGMVVIEVSSRAWYGNLRDRQFVLSESRFRRLRGNIRSAASTPLPSF